MDSSSSSFGNQAMKYDVYLSFRAVDTGHNFARHLYSALIRKNIKAVIANDHRIRGKEILSTITEVIKESFISVIIFSTNYASSRSCLQELVDILTCRKKYGQVVIPVFYLVDPSDVRKIRRRFGEGFDLLQKHFRVSVKELDEWRHAVKEAASLRGFHFKATRHQSVVVDKIVAVILEKLNNLSPSYSIESFQHVSKYEVYLSFLGKDTRYGFTSHLFAALRRAGIETFIGNGGDGNAPFILKAIEESKISVIVFSESYASSLWCLDEIVKIVACKREFGQIVVPVFYHVGKQTSSFGDDFGKQVKGFGKEVEMERRRAALSEVAGLPGISSHDTGCEGDLVEEIVNKILVILKSMYPSDNKDLVGVQSSINRIESLLCISLKDVRMVGIWGKGGIGKTTITKAVFNKLRRLFEESYFAENVREESRIDGLTHLRQELLSTILKDQHSNSGSTFIRQSLLCKKVFIIFDDVTSLEQINFLIGDISFFGLGSWVIITTRDREVLKNCGVANSNMYEVNALNHHEARQLFSWYAFQQNRPTLGYNELANRVVKFAEGFPLVLKVLGSFFLGKTKDVWEISINELESLPHDDILTVLEVIYNGLDDDEKNIFLDIVCLLKWKSRDFVIKFLDASGFFAEVGIISLIDKCLISISRNRITMHDLLQEMGWKIIQRSRLWRHTDIIEVLEDNTGSEEIEGIRLDMSEITKIHVNPSAFARMHRLRFLEVFSSHFEESNINKMHLSQGFESLPSELRYLCWHGYPFQLNFHLRNLVALDMSHSNVEELAAGDQCLFNLKSLNVSHSKNLVKFLDLSLAPNLEDLILEGCTSLTEFSSSTPCLSKLVNLNLRHCKTLCSLPACLHSKSLTTVILSCCSNLKTLPDISCNVEELFLDETAIEELPPSIENLYRLVMLNLKNCSRLKSLPSSICKLKTLEHLNLLGCSELDGLPDSLGDLEALKVLSVRGLAKMKVPSSITDLRFLMELNLTDCSIMELPNGLGRLSSLESLLLGRNNFKSIPSSIMDLSKLIYLDLGYCKRLQSLKELPCQLQYIAAHDCTSLEAVSSLSILFPAISRNFRANFINCFKLDQEIIALFRDSLQKIQDSMMEFCPRPGVYICFPGNEIPDWFSHQTFGSSINFKLQSGGFNTRLFSFAVSVVVEFHNYHGDGQGLVVGCDCKLEGRHVKAVLCYGILPDYVDSDHVFLGYDFDIFSFDLDDNQRNVYEGSIQFYVEDSNTDRIDCCKVKSCGVHLLYHQETGNPEFEVQAVTDDMRNDYQETEIVAVDDKEVEAVTEKKLQIASGKKLEINLRGNVPNRGGIPNRGPIPSRGAVKKRMVEEILGVVSLQKIISVFRKFFLQKQKIEKTCSNDLFF